MDTNKLSASKKSDFYNWQFLRLKPDYIDFAEHYLEEIRIAEPGSLKQVEEEWSSMAYYHFNIPKVYDPREDFPQDFEIIKNNSYKIFLESFTSMKSFGDQVLNDQSKSIISSLNPFQTKIPSKNTVPPEYQTKKRNLSKYQRNKIFKNQVEEYLDIDRFALVVFDLWSTPPESSEFEALKQELEENRKELLKNLRSTGHHQNMTNDEKLLKRTILAFRYWKDNKMCSAYEVSKSDKLRLLYGPHPEKDYSEHAQKDINRAIKLMMKAPNIPFSF